MSASPQPTPATRAWPTLDNAAYHGVVGEFVKLVGPDTEADPCALLVQFLAAFGNAAGHDVYAIADGVSHHLNINVAIVGETAKGRKGTSWARTRRPFEKADPDWASTRIMGGLSSGEGLIWAVRDRIEKKDKTGQVVVVDDGVIDKRLLIVEPEFANLFKVQARQGNTVAIIIRQAWDSGDINSLVKNSPGRATAAHISIIGHITCEELLRCLDSTDVANGLANRFIFCAVRRSKLLPFGGSLNDYKLQPIADEIYQVIRFASQSRQLSFSNSAAQLWEQIYADLSADRPGLLGALLARAEAQVLRLSCTYATLDKSSEIEDAHLKAALALWKYSEASCEYIFGDALGDPDADTILSALRRNAPGGLTRTDISALFGRNRPASHIDRALAVLLKAGRAHPITVTNQGRSVQRWVAVRKP